MTKERKYILIAGCLFIFLGLIYRFYPFGFDSFGDSPGIALKLKKIQKYTGVVNQKSYIEKYLTKLNKVYASSVNLFLMGSTPALGAVDIQNTLNKIAQKVGADIRRIDIRKAKKIENAGITRVPVRFSMTTTTRQLRDMIFHIESSPKLIRIINIQLSVAGKKLPESIRSTITVEGFIRE